MKKSKSQKSDEVTCWVDEEQVDCTNWDPVESDIRIEVTDDDDDAFIKLHKEYDL